MQFFLSRSLNLASFIIEFLRYTSEFLWNARLLLAVISLVVFLFHRFYFSFAHVAFGPLFALSFSILCKIVWLCFRGVYTYVYSFFACLLLVFARHCRSIGFYEYLYFYCICRLLL